MTIMFEQNYDSNFGLNFTKEHPYLPLGITFSYLSACYFGQQYMKNRPAYDLQSSLACWNLFLSTFSFIGMLRTVPQLIYNLNSMSLQDNLCTDPKESFANGACGLWVQLFIFSKTPELIDTFFIVARKKPLLFLHWYHHVTVLLFCWHSYSTEASTGLFFVAMNYSVHAIMYGYYFLMAVNAKPKWLNPGLITLSQISQMVIGTSLCAMTYSLLGTTNCAVKRENVVAGGLMYGSYLYLFCEFACKRFLTTKKVKKLCD
jgi:elongation of very long chain fatty acids protein 6